MIIQSTENLGTNQDGAPVVIDTDKQQNVVGTRVDSSLLTPTLQEIFYAIKGMGGAVPGTDNKQLLGILENLQSNLGNLNAAIQQEAQTRAANAASDKQALTNLIGQNTNALSGLSDTIATLTATTDSYNTNITQQVSNAQTEIGKIIDTLRDSLGVLTNEVNAIETNFDFREVEVSDANPNTSNDFSQYGVLIANADSGMSNTIVITGTASGIQGSSQMNACRARVVLVNVTSSYKAQFIYGQHTYNIDLTGISTVPRNVQFSITLASNGQAYSSGFQAEGVDNVGSIIAANGANIVVSNADSTDYQIKQVGVSKATGNVWASTADGTVVTLQASGNYVHGDAVNTGDIQVSGLRLTTGSSITQGTNSGVYVPGSVIVRDTYGNDTLLPRTQSDTTDYAVRTMGVDNRTNLPWVEDETGDFHHLVKGDGPNINTTTDAPVRRLFVGWGAAIPGIQRADNGQLYQLAQLSDLAAVSKAFVGLPLPCPTNNIPNGFLLCNGAPFNTAQYPLLAAMYPNGVLPDLRGLFIRGYDNAGRHDPYGTTRGLLSYEEGTLILGPQPTSWWPVVPGPATFYNNDMCLDYVPGLGWTGPFNNSKPEPGGGGAAPFNSGVSQLGTFGAARPKNMSFNYIVWSGTVV